MRSGYTDGCELDYSDLAMWRGRVASAMRGKRGQRLLRDILAALDAMPDKRLVKDVLVTPDGEACMLGAGALLRGVDVSDIEIDPYDSWDGHHETLAERLDVAACLVQEIEYINDEAGPYGRAETPEERYERARRWLVKNIKEPPAAAK